MVKKQFIGPSKMVEELVKVVMLERETRVAELKHALSLHRALLLALEGMMRKEQAQMEDVLAIRTTLNDLLIWHEQLLERHNAMIEAQMAYVEGDEDNDTLH